MRVAIISTDAPPMIGGIANHVSALSKSLRKIGVEVELFGGAAPRDTVANYIKSDISFSVNVTRQLLAYKPDLIHWHAIDSKIKPQRLWVRMWPSVWTNHTSHFLQNTMAYKWEANLPDAVIAPSREIKVLTQLILDDPEQVFYVPNGVDTKTFGPHELGSYVQPLAIASFDSWNTAATRVICPRRVEKKNGTEYFVRAAKYFRRYPNERVCFALLGDYAGCKRNDGRFVSEAGSEFRQADNVTFDSFCQTVGNDGPIALGAVPYADMPYYYQNADIAVFPSLLEGTSLACLEAMASECCVVATRTGGLCDIIAHKENGILVGAGSTQEIIKGIRYALDHPEERKAMGKRAREEVVSKYTWDHVAEYTAGIYRDVLARRLE